MRIEYCCECEQPTGKAGRCEDSLYPISKIDENEIGPLCDECYLGLAKQGLIDPSA